MCVVVVDVCGVVWCVELDMMDRKDVRGGGGCVWCSVVCGA